MNCHARGRRLRHGLQACKSSVDSARETQRSQHVEVCSGKHVNQSEWSCLDSKCVIAASAFVDFAKAQPPTAPSGLRHGLGVPFFTGTKISQVNTIRFRYPGSV